MRVALSKQVLTSVHSLNVGVSKEDIAPVITQIALSREGDNLRAIVTDRYVVLTGLYKDAEFDEWAEGEEMLIDPKHLKVVVDIVKKNNRPEPIVIHRSENGMVHALLGEDSTMFIGSLGGSFPPVMKLFPRDKPTGAGSLNIRPDFLAKLARVLPPDLRPERYRTWRFEFRTAPDSNKPQPVYAQYSTADTYQLEALIQPALSK